MGKRGRKRRSRQKNKYTGYNHLPAHYRNQTNYPDSVFESKYGCYPKQVLLMQIHNMLKDTKENREAIVEAKRILGTQWTYS